MDVRVSFPSHDRSVNVPSGTLLIDAVRSANLPIATACRGDGLCGRCGVTIVAGLEQVSGEAPDESRCKQRNRIDPRLRLACRIEVRADLSVTAPYW